MNNRKIKFRKAYLFCVILLGFCHYVIAQQNNFVSVKDHHFFTGDKVLYYIGTNYWYGDLLGLQKNKIEGISRLITELDFLKRNGVTNLRIVAGAEGDGLINGIERIGPALQNAKGRFDSTYLTGLDLLLSEMGKRNMKAVIFLSNNWEWSGGFLQYLNWNGEIADSILRRKLTWDETRDYVSKFYLCKPCQADYLKQVSYVLNHINSINQKKYREDDAIMSWEIANEPRPMRPAVIELYKEWISSVAAYIKSMDKQHLVTTGTEGYIGTENMQVYETIHADKNIDYLTIHIWPKNWDWFSGAAIAESLDSIIYKTAVYISAHLEIADKLNKPLVIEEFGLPRDHISFDLHAATTLRDQYFAGILAALEKSKKNYGLLSAVNFWSYGGNAIPPHVHWQKGDRYTGDPPMEEQGLNSVFDSDQTTWNIISKSAQRLR